MLYFVYTMKLARRASFMNACNIKHAW